MMKTILPPLREESWRRSHPVRAVMLACFALCISLNTFAQSTIRGKVTDESGVGLPGVNILFKGTASGTTTDANGDYAIQVPADGGAKILVFSFIGYQTVEQAADGRTTIDVSLATDVTALSEIVVIGYGEVSREAVTGSVVSLSGSGLREIPAPNITQALQGRLAGVDLAQNSTKPGATMQIRIRGTRSLTASNDPLVVLDGIPFAGSLSDINPNDIKSLDILKDASSTAIYGSRGANGVILVTTNKGQRSQKAQINYNGYVGVKSVFAKYPMMSGSKFEALRNEAGIYTNGQDEESGVNTDWQDMFYSSAVVSSHDVGILGGTDAGSYNIGLGYYKDVAVIPGQDYNRIALRTALDQKVGEYIRVGFTTNNNYSVSNGNNLSMYDVLSLSPIADPYNPDGSFKRTIRMPLDETWTRTRSTIEDLGDTWMDVTKNLSSYNSIYGEVQVPWVKGLSYRINLGLNYRQTNGGQYTGEGVFAVNPSTQSSATINNTTTSSWTVENLLTYERSFGKHNLNLVGLYSAQQDEFVRFNANARDVPNDDFLFYNLGRANIAPVINPDLQNYTLTGLVSTMGRLMYSYDDRYMLTASYRFDGSSRLAPGNKWFSYPAISAGWNIHKESFMSNVGKVNQLKLRVGYGLTSNQAVDPYKTLGSLGAQPYNFGATNVFGFNVFESPNPNLGWEFSATTNYALEFGLFNNRLSGTIEYYHTKTDDLLMFLNLPQTSGVSRILANIGSSENKGVEFTLNGVILDKPDGLKLEAGVNIYSNRNELTKLASGQLRDESNWWFVGHPIDVIFDYEAVGLWQDEDVNRALFEPGPLTGVGGTLGMIKVKYTGDFNTDGTPVRPIGPADRQIMSMQPKFQGGFNTRLTYKGFDLSLVGFFKSGGLLIATPYGANGYLNILSGRRGNIDVDYWTPTNTDATYPRPGAIGGDQPKYLNSLSYFDASFLKMRTITLGYDFDQSNWFKVKGISRMRAYATIQNPFVLFSPYYRESGMDPETNSYANDGQNSAVAYPQAVGRLLSTGTNTPSTRNIIFGLNVTF
jgi:TonB-linked SusC/RagA family outer membrane protein